MASPLWRFVLKAVAWLPPAFAVWYFSAPVLFAPVRLLVEIVVRLGFGDIVSEITQSGSVYTFATNLRPGRALGQSGNVTVDVTPLLYSYGLPLFVALVLAAREAGWPRKLALGYAVMVPFITWGVVTDFLIKVAITSGPFIASQTGFAAWQREAIAFAFQLGSLIMPTVVPAVMWVVTHRVFFERLRSDVPQGRAS